MNKKFSTLMAGLLLATAFSANAAIDAKQGQFVEIQVSGEALQIATDNTLQTAAKVASEPTAVTTKAGLEAAFAQQWQVASIKYDTNSGTPIYQFINKATGQYLAVNLKTDNKGASTAAAKINAAGNKSWCLDASNHLYVYQNDSTYTFDEDMKLIAAKGATVPAGAAAFTIGKNDIALNLNAAVLNALMGKGGKLYFNGENVTDGEKNVIADNQWKAYAESTGAFFLGRAGKDSITSGGKNPYLLMVDTAKYAGSNYFKLTVDTLALKDQAEIKKLKNWKDAVSFVASNYNPTEVNKYNRLATTAMFNGTYTLGNDSIRLTTNTPGDPLTIRPITITDGESAYTGSNGGAIQDQIPGWTEAVAESEGTAIRNLANAVQKWLAEAAQASTSQNGYDQSFAKSKFNPTGQWGSLAANADGEGTDNDGVLTLADAWAKSAANNGANKDEFKALVASAKSLKRLPSLTGNKYYFLEGYNQDNSIVETQDIRIAQLSNTKVLTVGSAPLVLPLIQAVSTKGGDAKIDGNGKVYFMQLASEPESETELRALSLKGKYVVADPATADRVFDLADEVDAANVYAQWGFIEGATGYYQIVNRATGDAVSLPINKTTKAGVYEIDGEEYRLIEVDLSNADIREEKGVKYDYTGYYYGGPADGVSQSFQITPASALLSNVAVQFNKDSVLVLGKAENAPVWYLEGGDKTETWGAEIPGLPQLKRVEGYKIYTADAEGTKYYVYKNTDPAADVYAITKANSGKAASKFQFRTQAANAYLFVDGTDKATINLNLNVPTIEVSAVGTERNDYFSFAKSEYSDYRTLVAEDGLLGNAKIYMENEPSRFLYENTKNVVANNGNSIAKDSLNFLGIYNAMASVQNAALYIDTAYVDRKDNYRPQYMLAVGVTEVAATEGHACTETGKHFDADGKETTADKCVHATPGTEGYKTGRYLVTLQDSVATGFTKHPALYDGNFRLAFVEAKHIKDTLEIANSKFTVEDHSADTIKVGKDLQKATFALKIVDQSTKSFVMETADKTYVRILNGVPVLTSNIADAAVFNIAATTEEATANEAIEASQVTVIGGQGVVTVQGAAGKVITVANILGQTIANQVAASDNVTIAAPAGVVVVAVEGEATKVVVK